MRRVLSTLLAGGLLAFPLAGAVSASAPPHHACSDGVDNDGDGLADFRSGGDPACTSPLDDNEADPSVVGVTSPPDASVTIVQPPAPSFGHTVHVSNDGLVPLRVTLTQSHRTVVGPGTLILPVSVVPGASAPAGCTRSTPPVDIQCDVGMIVPGGTVTVDSTVIPFCSPLGHDTADVTVTTSVEASPVSANGLTASNTARTTYHVICGGLPGPGGLPGLPGL